MPDPRFGLAAAYAGSTTTRLPSGLTRAETRTKAFELTGEDSSSSLLAVTEQVTVNGVVATSRYDAATRTLTWTSPGGRTSSVTFDLQGTPVGFVDANGAATSITLDSAGRALSMARGDRTASWSYDSAGRLSATTNALGQTTLMQHDDADRLTSVTTPGGATTEFAYDAAGRMIAVTPPEREAHEFAYTSASDLASYEAPAPASAGARFLYEVDYDLDGRVVFVAEPNGSSVTMGYDAGSRPVTLTHPRGTVRWTYDTKGGRLATAETAAVTLSYQRDGRLLTSTSWSGAVSGSVTRTYDTFFRLSKETVTGTAAVPYTYDLDGAVVGAGAMTLAYEATSGRLDTTALGSVTDDVDYDPEGAVSAYTATAAGTEPYAVTYGRDLLGRIVTKTEAIEGVTKAVEYAYDDDGRLVSVAENGEVVRDYAYDANGNRLETHDLLTNQVTEGVYDVDDRIVSQGDTDFTFDDNGRITYREDGRGVTAYDYDVFGDLRSVTLPDGRLVEYELDANGRRVGKRVDGAPVAGWLWQDDLRIVAELDGAGAVKTRFVYPDGAGAEEAPVANLLRRLGLGSPTGYAKTTTPAYVVRDAGVYRVVADHLGSPRLLVDTATGAVVGRRDYDEWGRVLSDTLSAWLPQGFAGGLYDADTGLVRFGARDYEAETGRWMARDPVRFEGGQANLWAYVRGDPVNGWDRDGCAETKPYLKLIKRLLCALSLGWLLDEGIECLEQCKKACPETLESAGGGEACSPEAQKLCPTGSVTDCTATCWQHDVRGYAGCSGA